MNVVVGLGGRNLVPVQAPDIVLLLGDCGQSTQGKAGTLFPPYLERYMCIYVYMYYICMYMYRGYKNHFD